MSRITVLPDGPYLVEEPPELLDATGAAFDTGGRARIALCRCGHSRNKPFCDGSHKKAGFRADDPAPRK